jgi:hypothetical protein
LGALEGELPGWLTPAQARAIIALRAALAQEEQEPVAMCRTWHKGSDQHAELLEWSDSLEALPDGEHLLYTHPPRREWQRLTNEEMYGLYRRAGLEAYYPRDGVVQGDYDRRIEAYARAIEAKIKKKNA